MSITRSEKFAGTVTEIYLNEKSLPFFLPWHKRAGGTPLVRYDKDIENNGLEGIIYEMSYAYIKVKHIYLQTKEEIELVIILTPFYHLFPVYV